MTHLLDTNTCIHLLRGRDATVGHAGQHSPSDPAVSAITRHELLYGVEKCPPGWRKKESGKVRLLRILPFTADTSAHAATLRAALGVTSRSIGPMDVVIAATALEYDLPVVNNLAEFQRVPGLQCESWAD